MTYAPESFSIPDHVFPTMTATEQRESLGINIARAAHFTKLDETTITAAESGTNDAALTQLQDWLHDAKYVAECYVEEITGEFHQSGGALLQRLQDPHCEPEEYFGARVGLYADDASFWADDPRQENRIPFEAQHAGVKRALNVLASIGAPTETYILTPDEEWKVDLFETDPPEDQEYYEEDE